jgi:phosphopantothenate synthetase
MNDLSKIEHEGQVVITTELLAKHYGVNSNTIKNAYSRNKRRFIERVHYYKLEDRKLIKNIVMNYDHDKTVRLKLWFSFVERRYKPLTSL